MQNLKIQEFDRNSKLLLPDTNKRRQVLPTIVGLAIGSFLPVKQGHELTPQTCFADAHAGNVSRVVSFLNEQLLLDVPTALESARAMYIVRHRIVNGEPCDFAANPEFDFLATAIGLAPIMPVETYVAIKETGLSAAKVLSMAKNMIHDLKAAKQITL